MAIVGLAGPASGNIAPAPDYEVAEAFDPSIDTYELSCGNKTLELVLADDNREAITIINNGPGPRLPGATTALYIRAHGLLRRLAGESGDPIAYTFSTTNPRMQAWAQTHGATIFRWRVSKSDAESFVAERTIAP